MPLLDDAPGPLGSLLHRKRAYVVPDLKLLYVSLAKNACTSLKWLVAELAHEDPAQFTPGLGSATTRDDGIHSRGRWRNVPLLDALTEEQRASLSPQHGWFVFAVVRDPRVRLFSAWENKFLLRNPKYVGYADQPWYPRVPSSAEDVVEDFAAFVRMLEDHPEHALHQDSHFASQTTLLGNDDVPYSRIYDISELRTLLADLGEHLAAQGRQDPLRLRHANDTPLVANGAVFAGGVQESVEKLFAADFERFGHHWDLAKVQVRPAWSDDALKHTQAVIAHAERIAELRDIALTAVEERNRLRRRLAREQRTRAAGAGSRPGLLRRALRRL